MTQKVINHIPGIFAAHSSDNKGGTGCTVIVCPQGATAGVDVCGGAPATRETDLLRPEETVDVVHAVVLSGGSAFGLAASCGVADELERRGIGYDVNVTKVPIVCGACLFDLAVGDPHARPSAQDGARAAALALDEPQVELRSGNVGAGCGCSVGKLAGPERAMKSGFGQAVLEAGPLIVGAVAAVNAVGDVRNPDSHQTLAGVRTPGGSALANSEDILRSLGAKMPLPRTNTTLSCIVTNAALTKAQATKLAQMASDAYARTIFPTHTTNDGDSVFVLATGTADSQAPVQLDALGSLAVRALELAIVDAVMSAEPAFGLPSVKSALEARSTAR